MDPGNKHTYLLHVLINLIGREAVRYIEMYQSFLLTEPEG